MIQTVVPVFYEGFGNYFWQRVYNDLSSLFGSLAQAYYAVLSNSFHVNGTHGPDGKKIEGGYFNWDLAKAKSDLAKSQRIYNEQKSKLEEKLEKCANIQ